MWGPLAQWEVLLLPKEQWDTETGCWWQEDVGAWCVGCSGSPPPQRVWGREVRVCV